MQIVYNYYNIHLEAMKYRIMKKVLLLFAICSVCSCTGTNSEEEMPQEKRDSIRVLSHVEEVEIKGHIYLIFEGGDYKGGNIIHAEHCPCKNKIK